MGKTLAAPDRIVEMHRTTPRYEEDVPDSVIGKSFSNVVGDTHYFSLRENSLKSMLLFVISSTNKLIELFLIIILTPIIKS